MLSFLLLVQSVCQCQWALYWRAHEEASVHWLIYIYIYMISTFIHFAVNFAAK